MSNAEPKSPLTIIAIFAGIIEASALASLPFLSEGSQSTYTWFLVGFPFFLTVLFFLTLNFNYQSLYSPAQAEVCAAPETDTSPQPLLEEKSPIGSPSIESSTDTDIELSKPAPSSPATVTITMSGARASQLLEYFTLHALNQARPLCNNWVLYNLETGTRTTLATESIDK